MHLRTYLGSQFAETGNGFKLAIWMVPYYLAPMTDFTDISGLGEVADDYDALLCDIWGVMHNGKIAYHDACAALERFRAERGPVILISNSPRPSAAIPAQFAQIGVPGEPFDAIVTSGDATINELAAFKLGPDRDDVIYEGMEMHFSALEDAAFISWTGLFDDDVETPEDYRNLLNEAADMGISMVCANPDVQVKRDGKLIYCGGALAQLYDEIGGKVIYAGKPHSPIYELSRAWVEEIAGYDIPKDRVLAIGDNIFTDLLGAQQEDYDCLYIQDGLHADNSEQLKAILNKHGIIARYMAGGLRW